LDYKQFLERKKIMVTASGFDINAEELNEKLFDFQKDIVKWALKKGRAAIFADCGLGKTPMQLEWSNQVHKKDNLPILILAPLAVAHQTVSEGDKFNIKVNYAENQSQIINGINITNYEKLHHFDASKFNGIVLDESSILKSYSGKTRNTIIESFNKTNYRLACTATPSPNDFTELGNHSEFLGVQTRAEMLSMFFINDTANVGTWRLKGHAEKEYWKWVSNWSIMLTNPRDLGYNQVGYDLPEIQFIQHTVEVEQNLNGQLFKQLAQTLEERRDARKISLTQRVNKCKEIVNQDKDAQWLIWCDYNAESELLSKEIDNSTEVTGSQKDDEKSSRMLGFAKGEVQILVSKSKIAGFGLNFQKCHNIIYCGLSDSYESFYQSVRRCYRFGQENKVKVHIVISDLEGNIIENIKRKERDAIKMQKEMIAQLQLFEIKQLRGHMDSSMEYKQNVIETEQYKAILGDSVEEIKRIQTDSIHYQLFSPPFASLFTFSNSVRDLSNTKTIKEFMDQYKFLAEEQYRISMPGRLLSFHVMNLPSTITSDGFIGIKDLRGDLIRLYQEEGFIFHSEVVIWKDPKLQAVRTKTLSLAHKQIIKDSARCSQGFPDYIITMRKPGENPEPVSKTNGFEKYIGEMENPKNKKNDNPAKNKYSQDVWERYASPVWTDIRQTRTLNVRSARENGDERHMTPTQLDVVERCIELWTNPNDTVFSPFMGIGSEGYGAILQGRKFIGIELKESYFNVAVKNLENATQEKEVKTFFD